MTFEEIYIEARGRGYTQWNAYQYASQICNKHGLKHPTYPEFEAAMSQSEQEDEDEEQNIVGDFCKQFTMENRLQCDECGRWYERSDSRCPECGFERAISSPDEPDEDEAQEAMR